MRISLSDAIDINNYMGDQFDMNIIDIIIKFGMGIVSNCIQCNKIIITQTRFDYITNGINNNNDKSNENADDFYKYIISDPKSIKFGEFRYILGELVRIWCNDCRPNKRRNDKGKRCKYNQGNTHCNNWEFGNKCAAHRRCSECRSGGKTNLSECKLCGKYTCNKCQYDGYCDSCNNKSVYVSQRRNIENALPIFNEQIVSIIMEYANGYILYLDVNVKRLMIELYGYFFLYIG